MDGWSSLVEGRGVEQRCVEGESGCVEGEVRVKKIIRMTELAKDDDLCRHGAKLTEVPPCVCVCVCVCVGLEFLEGINF